MGWNWFKPQIVILNYFKYHGNDFKSSEVAVNSNFEIFKHLLNGLKDFQLKNREFEILKNSKINYFP